ncbi:MAG: response regulator transcription factor [Aminobacterium sp.]|jgi:DNA-binding NarL/FixJ family response regulator|uniref:response regulator n=1 Tax=unclassified Aminobacterium TaxID=2685012 RepID=UPI001BCE29B1|nr:MULTISPECIES: response regulator transcription factor [unclassified Aminobacterium]MDD2206107.1 response regulator transcription factor [Aminobacterium sp.]MDD3427110.1 response regulator transcription factor [Aminobacterium sp.]MDD3707826.1 response regulator transcription factor [Aminobacterium sp.]MDD4228049.1 response regulator transcription factor [Aminobacterium sp.]MDD4551104.1 response regulator transcription factor [Aminobacterium sp.]
MDSIRLVIADDHRLFRDGVKKLLELESDIDVIGEAGDGEEALKVVREKEPDVLLFDINMPKIDGIQLVRELNSYTHAIKYVAVSAYDDEDSLSALSSAGVLGFVLKASGRVELLSAIRSANRNQPYVDPRVAGKLLTSFSRRKEENDQLYELTPREKEILYWLAQGLSNSEVAAKMVLSEKTVKNHVSHVLKKLDLRDRTQAAILAWRIGFAQLQPDSLRQVISGSLSSK